MQTVADLRFRQSMAKVLLSESPAHLKHKLDHGWKATRAMDAGSLFDYVVFDDDQKYEIVDARYESGERAGQVCDDWTGKQAGLAGKAARARGLLPVLPCELEAVAPQAAVARRRFRELAGSSIVYAQQTVLWASALDLECEGTPDWILVDPVTGITRTVDLKKTASVKREWFARQVHAMGWDVQAAAYKEAALSFARDELEAVDSPAEPVYGGHTILACEAGGIGMVRAYPLDAAYLEVGRIRWERAQRIWSECVAKDEWPGYSEEPIGPSLYVTRTELERYEFADEEP
jgi:hypothetical protein